MSIYREARCGWKKGRVLYELSKETKKASYQTFLNKYFTQEELNLYVNELTDSHFWKEFKHKKDNFDLDRGPICFNSLHILYALVRKYKPKTIVETGIHFGGSSALFLFALHMNQQGKLISIDKWTEAPIEHIGYFVPEWLKGRWEPMKGYTRDVLPTLNKCDFFLHDSAHNHSNMTFEYEWAIKHISKDGFISSHDIGATNAFFDFSHNWNLQYYLLESDFSGRYSIGIAQVNGDRKKIDNLYRPNLKVPKNEKYTNNLKLTRNHFDEGRAFAKKLTEEGYDIRKEMVKWMKGTADEYIIYINGKKKGRIAPRNGCLYGGYFKGKAFRILNNKDEQELYDAIKGLC